MKRAITTLTAALLGATSAQEIATSLPLTSVGDKLLWTVGDQDLKLVVGVSSRVQLDVYGAQFDPEDYRSDDYYGDENYSPTTPKEPVTSMFTLVDAEGQVVKTQDFGVGAQDWQTFINEDLPAGTYTLKVQTQGNGKNTFALRLNSISANVQADQLNVTIRSNDWVPAINVYNPGGEMTVRMYDGDGAEELEAQLRDAQGNITPLKVSGDLEWGDLDIPSEKGNYTIYLRQPAETYQYSNTVGFELTSGPITVVKTETTGKLEILAELVLPNETLPTQANVKVGERDYAVDGAAGPYALPLEEEYPVSVEPVKGAEVTVDTEAVTLEAEETKQIKVQIKPDVALSFAADKSEVCVGDVVTFTAEATTEFERQKLPVEVNVELPEGLTADGETVATAQVDAANPAKLTFEAKATGAVTGTIGVQLSPWEKAAETEIKVLPDATKLELRRAEIPSTLQGEVVDVVINLKNTGDETVPYELQDEVDAHLEALDPTQFSGELAAGEEKELKYRARVTGEAGADSALKASLSSTCNVQQTSEATFTVLTPPPPPKPAPAPAPKPAPEPEVVVQRESTVRIPFDAPKSANQIIIAHLPPKDAAYVPGSSRLDGKPVADPQVGESGKFYWTTPGAQRGVLSYKVTHEGALPALNSPTLIGRYAKNTLEVLVGEGNLDDLQQLQTFQGTQEDQENVGSIKLPVAGTVFRDRDRVTVVVETGSNSTVLPTLNGKPIDLSTLGKKVVDEATGTKRQEFYGLQLVTGENLIKMGDQTVKVYLAGTPVTAQLKPEQLVADGVTPIRVAVKVLDANGLSVGSNVTVQTSTEVVQGDARPQVGSYQVQLTDGEGTLELPAMAVPGRFDVRVLVGDETVNRSFEAIPSKTRVGIGLVSVGALMGIGTEGTPIAAEARGNGYLETPIGDGKLYVAASGAVKAEQTKEGFEIEQDREQGLPTTANPVERYPSYGDSSTESIPLQGIDPVAFRYEHPAFNVQYRQSVLPVNVFDLGLNPTALSAFSRTNPMVSGFAAFLPDVTYKSGELPANGTRVLPLAQGEIEPDSEVVTLVTTNRLTGAKTRKELKRLVDYTFDYVSGVIYFQGPINLYDLDGNMQSVEVQARLSGKPAERKLAFGVQASMRLLEDRLNVAAAVVSLPDFVKDSQITYGVRAKYNDGISKADALVAMSDGEITTSATASVTTKQLTVKGSAKYQTENYKGLNKAKSAGVSAKLDADYKVTENIGVGVGGYYTSDLKTEVNNGGYVEGRAKYTFEGFSVGAGVRSGFGTKEGLSVKGSLGYTRDNWKITVDHSHPIGDGDKIKAKPETGISIGIPLVKNVSLIAKDNLIWGKELSQKASVGLEAKFGMTNLSVGYELPGADGWGNRARFGADTTLPIGDKFSVNLTGSLSQSFAQDAKNATRWNAGTSLRYKDTHLTASLGSDISNSQGSTEGFSVAIRGGMSYSLNDQFTVSAEGTRLMNPDNTSGNNAAASLAMRAGQWQGLAYLRYKDGVLANNEPEVIGEANLEYHVPRYALRGGVAGRALLNQEQSPTYQVSASGTYYLTERLGLGLAGRALFQPANPNEEGTAFSAGVEASYRVLPGTWVTAGYNPVGFTGIGTNGIYTRQGAYVRLDLMLDDGQVAGEKSAPQESESKKSGSVGTVRLNLTPAVPAPLRGSPAPLPATTTGAPDQSNTSTQPKDDAQPKQAPKVPQQPRLEQIPAPVQSAPAQPKPNETITSPSQPAQPETDTDVVNSKPEVPDMPEIPEMPSMPVEPKSKPVKPVMPDSEGN